MPKSPCYKLPNDSDGAAVFRAAARFVLQGPWTLGTTVPLTLHANADEVIEYQCNLLRSVHVQVCDMPTGDENVCSLG